MYIFFPGRSSSSSLNNAKPMTHPKRDISVSFKKVSIHDTKIVNGSSPTSTPTHKISNGYNHQNGQ